jgi:glyoxylase-like metal-dependent hydrolase (beta-lactamase superfamily II)
MIIKRTGRIADDFYILGQHNFPTHLLTGRKPALFEAGLACLGPVYVNAIGSILNQTQPCFLFLTHVHFDHCGAAAFLKKAFPALKICASDRARDIIQRPNAVKTIAMLSREVSAWIEAQSPGVAEDVPFEAFEVDQVLSDGDRIGIDENTTVHVLATPGHTWDALSYYVPEKKLLLAGEAGGIMDPSGFFFAEFLVDYDSYMDSMERLAALDVEILSQSHHHVFTGEDARSFYPRSIQAAKKFKARVEMLLDRENGDIEKVVSTVKAQEYDPKPDPKQPEPAYLLNLEARVRHLAGRR